MGITTRKAAIARPNIDKAAYIGMEIEHSNDTSAEIPAFFQKQAPNIGVDKFRRSNESENRNIRLEAYKKN